MNAERLKLLLAEYGRVALVTYFAIFVLVLVGFAVAISAGVQVESAASGAGVLGAAYVATKVTQPLRIAGTLALTPLIARITRRFGAARSIKPEPVELERPVKSE